MIKAKVVADSIGPSGIRLTTFELTYPRFIHAELMTHRAFSRNAASSRAIPVKKMMARIRKQPAMPEVWGLNRPGMQATHEAEGFRLWLGKKLWVLAGRFALAFAWMLMKLNFHKQITNRILEPWSHIVVILTADQFGLANMWAQRDHDDAQPEFRILARKAWVAYNQSIPKTLKMGEWHLPYIFDWDRIEIERYWFNNAKDKDTLVIDTLKRISVGRCARVSYLNHNGARHLGDDEDLCKKLMIAKPGHWSPFEHVAQAMPLPAASGNIRGWKQFRKEFETENIVALPVWDRDNYAEELREYFALLGPA